MAPPIRVAIIGLSASGASVTSWASIAHLPYLLSERGQANYKIVALLNSSVAAAKKAIETYKLPAETRAYGDPAALAADKDVDLVVCNTRVDTHYDTIYPSLAAGKDVYTEWPLAENAAKARELATLADKSGSKTIVGLQGRLSPLTLKVKELLEQGRIGKVLSSEVRATIGITPQLGWPHGFSFFYEREVGGNPYTISFGHAIDLVQSVLGEATTIKGHFQLQHPTGKLFNMANFLEAIPSVQSNVPDLMIATVTLPESATVTKGATLFVSLESGTPFPGNPQHEWIIRGEAGKIRVVSEDRPTLQMLESEKLPPTIQVHTYEVAPPGTPPKVENVEWKWEGWQEELPRTARNVANMYERFAAGEKVYPTFADAAVRQGQLDGALDASGWEA